MLVLEPQVADDRLDPEGMTLDGIGRELGVSRERARQIEQETLLKLRIALEILELVGEARADATLRWLRGRTVQAYVVALETLRAATQKRGERVIVECKRR